MLRFENDRQVRPHAASSFATTRLTVLEFRCPPPRVWTLAALGAWTISLRLSL